MIGRAVGTGFARARDAVARLLLALGVGPNGLSVTGAVFTAAAAGCYAVDSSGRFAWALRPGAAGSAWLLLAGGLLVLSFACDMLDGAVARLGGRKTDFGAFLDSTLDRFSDFAVYAGMAVHFILREPANLTFALLAMLSFFNAFMISYTKARAEDLIDSCGVGFWQRGERSAAILIATFSHNIPALLIQQASLPLLTVWRRVSYTRDAIRARRGRPAPRAPEWLDGIRIWRHPRMTWGYDAVVAVNIAWLIFAPIRPTDVLRGLLP